MQDDVKYEDFFDGPTGKDTKMPSAEASQAESDQDDAIGDFSWKESKTENKMETSVAGEPKVN